MESACPDEEHVARYMKLLTEVQKVAARVFSKHSLMFPNLPSMYSIPLEFQHCPMKVKADYLETQLQFLKELDQQADTTVQSNTERQVCPQLEPQRPSSAQMILQSAVPAPATLAAESGSESISEVPPPPASLTKGGWGKDKTSKLAAGCTRTCKIEYWRFCYKMCLSERTAVQKAHLNESFEKANPTSKGHSKWLENKEILLYLYHTARVKIEKSQVLLVKTLKRFWEERSESLLKLLRQWFRSGAAASIPQDDFLKAALQHIRSEWKETDWWPNHGDDIDKQCLTESVVTEDRLLEEWAVCKQQRADYDYFRSEFETLRLEHEKSQLVAARTKKMKTSSNTSAIDALAAAAVDAAAADCGCGAAAAPAGDDAGVGTVPQRAADSWRAPAADGGLGAAGHDVPEPFLGAADAAVHDHDVPEPFLGAADAAVHDSHELPFDVPDTDYQQFYSLDDASRDSTSLLSILRLPCPQSGNAAVAAAAEEAAAAGKSDSAATGGAHAAATTAAEAAPETADDAAATAAAADRRGRRGSDPGAARVQLQQDQQAGSVSPLPSNAAAGEDSAAAADTETAAANTACVGTSIRRRRRRGLGTAAGNRSSDPVAARAQQQQDQQAGSVSPLPSNAAAGEDSAAAAAAAATEAAAAHTACVGTSSRRGPGTAATACLDSSSQRGPGSARRQLRSGNAAVAQQQQDQLEQAGVRRESEAHAGRPRPGPEAGRGSPSTAAQQQAAQQASSVSPLPSEKGYIGFW